MRIHTATHTGLVRPSNQDSLLVMPGVLGVADGMGGHKGGETASRVAVEVMKNALSGKKACPQALRVGIEAANRRVFEMQKHDDALTGMGTTFSLVWEGDGEMLIGHIGDSRVYLLRDGALQRVTQDHSLVAELMRNGVITPEEARVHPYRSVITRALGTDAVVTPDVFAHPKKQNDVWLACSDGLTNMVDDEALARVLTTLTGESAVERLIELALQQGGLDNVTVALGVVEEADGV